jgi:uncharacterized membrane protein YjgN (DUF898 family)
MNEENTGGGAAPRVEALAFRGSGGEYFRIWIVNLLLTIVTFGIYSAWAKVRRLRYFYGNTWLAGSNFNYHGEPIAILRGRLIAFGLFMVYSVGGRISPALGAICALALFVAVPWLIVRSRSFKLRMSSYRNIRFRFVRDYRGAIAAIAGWGLATVLSFGLLFPYAQYKWQHFLVRNSSYGTTAFVPAFTGGAFYRVYLRFAGALLLAIVVAGLAAGMSMLRRPGANDVGAFGTVILVGLMFYAIVVVGGIWVQTASFNLVHGETVLGPHRLRSELSPWRMVRVYGGNLLLIALTLGLYTPWAQVRIARARIDALALEVQGSLDEFIAAEDREVSAMGEEIGEFFDFDFGF